jgi:hypothetical protein
MESSDPLPVKNTFIEFRPSRPSWRRADSMPDPRYMGSKNAETPSPDRRGPPGKAYTLQPEVLNAMQPIASSAPLTSSDLSDDDLGEAEDCLQIAAAQKESSLEDFAEMQKILDRVRDKIPRDPNGNLTSIGSIKHDRNQCKPCVFVFHAGRVCANGIACEYCHFWHPPKKRARASKRKRLERKAKELEKMEVDELEEWRGLERTLLRNRKPEEPNPP